MSREMAWTSDDPDFAQKFAWALHEVLGCPLRADAHDESGWCVRQEHLLEIAERLRRATLQMRGARSESEALEGQMSWLTALVETHPQGP